MSIDVFILTSNILYVFESVTAKVIPFLWKMYLPDHCCAKLWGCIKVKPFWTDFYSLFICCSVIQLSKIRRGFNTLRLAFFSHRLYMCLSQASSLSFQLLSFVVVYHINFVYESGREFELFYMCHFEPFVFDMSFVHCWRLYDELYLVTSIVVLSVLKKMSDLKSNNIFIYFFGTYILLLQK